MAKIDEENCLAIRKRSYASPLLASAAYLLLLSQDEVCSEMEEWDLGSRHAQKTAYRAGRGSLGDSSIDLEGPVF